MLKARALFFSSETRMLSLICLTAELICRQQDGAQTLKNHQTLMGDETFEKLHAVGGQVQRFVRWFYSYF
ncbi:hypothetical protein CEE34_02890 [Candidatus Aerophobetes bacterium Ae_b3a]|nr:MAG: hypothetical protein CEE34_02890 [Candidatus Aerophobetes bacterium Ae_b3a]